MSYVVPGANPIQPGVQSVSAGTNISISGTAQDPIINNLTKLVATNTATLASIPGSMTEIATMSLNITTTSDLSLFATIATSAVGLSQSASAILTSGIWIDNILVGNTFQDAHHGNQGGGSTSVNTFSYAITKQPQTAGNITVSLRASSSITSPTISITRVNLTAIGQLQ